MTGDMSSELVFYVNGIKVVEENAEPETTLLQFLRQKLGLTGTKLGCGEGGCGACTVMVSRFDHYSKKICHFSVNACLAPLCSMHGMAVTTVEGIGSVKNGLHPVQERLAKSHGSQCGFCTPGIIMSMYTLLRNDPQPTIEHMEKAFEGNLCRCTGYRPILDGFRTFTKEYCAMGENCCKNKNGNNNLQLEDGVGTDLVKTKAFLPLDATQDPIFPPELQNSTKFDTDYLIYRGERVVWHRPTKLDELLDLKSTYPDARLVVGNTEIGVEMKFKNMKYPVMIAPTHIPELVDITHTDLGIRFGASVTLSRIDQELKEAIAKYSEPKTRVFTAVIEMLRWFAGYQIRNVAAVAGNIITASPISDLNPLFLACGAVLEVQSKESGRRQITMDEKFFLGYRKTALTSTEVVINILLPFTSKNEYFGGYKQAYRREDDIATVNSGIYVVFEDNSNVIKKLSLAYGGMAITTIMPTRTMAAVVGRKWDDSLVMDICRLLADDLPLQPGSPGGMVEYRRTLTISFFFKFYLSVQMQLQSMHLSKTKVPSYLHSATAPFHRDPSKSTQIYQEVASGQREEDPVGRPINHLSAMKQATGEAVYIDDMPKFQNELYMGFVMSKKAYANIKSVDASEALSMPGVVDYISHVDVPGKNTWGAALPDDEEIFATTQVLCEGQIIGGIVAETQIQAQRAAKCVKVEYEELKPIITIKEAIEAGSFFGSPQKISCGDVEAALQQADHVIEGECHVGGQEHFYLETQAVIAIPKGEDGEMEMFISTQNPTESQHVTAEALNVPANRIVVRVKRIGGGFGGKETRSVMISTPVAIAANKLGRPVRVMLDRDEDMLMTGTRHPFYAKYKIGFMDGGKITALEINIYNNAGMSQDLSWAVMHRAMFHSDNAYKIPNLSTTGHVCRTNISSNTAFRGFGGPQGMMVVEQCITDVAYTLGVSPIKVRELNLYQEGDRTHYGQLLEHCTVQRCWDECLNQSDYFRRKKEVDIFNSENRWKKRGITIVPTKFGIAYTALFLNQVALNQAGALVHIYMDGSVLLTHAGVEMGQGLHTKMIQVASRALRIPASKIHTSEVGTNTVPNTSPTAASCGSDLNGMAVINACKTLLERLEPIMLENPKGTWEDWIKSAYINRISLSATGFYKTPGIGYDFNTGKGRPFNYFTSGVACSEVEIDCLTGDHQVLRTDIVMDVGVSLNPAIDIGQIEGGFTQGYGLMMMEQQKISPKGILYTRGPGNYKIPGFGDIPVQFNVTLLKGSVNEKAVYSSKAIGEPPLFLSSSVFFAAKDAIASARADAGHHGNFILPSPATPERVRMACEDQFTDLFPKAKEGTFTPWFVEL
ncbi:xanthine dehydrogenase/oxidase-like isoform X1 [Mercenaria mercenaria]|uniref:xanthine dehydrogenase/oxidase-like isoform X1 n=1 Tax=Mercenaria mercenaria TaxID=6596 RepID=UPI00234F47F5|nr:xanthine dehydrogenase/oxidase-like isoform X1 [Mercenaria mercenaria]